MRIIANEKLIFCYPQKYIEWRGDDVVVKLYTVEDSIFSSSIIFLWITACLCVAIGSLTGPYQDLQW